MRFTYASGQRPLDGYTIKRGVGCGGFGEVYFAISDGGKEVALKLVRGQADVELRGISQCLNLKHPNLVHLYDLRTSVRGEPWVVMEYVSGDPLSLVLNRYSKGVPVELARQWFLELARAIGYLHDHGIVHRDLKPANIFLERGILKVGDYGLAKSISASAGGAHTQSVGTVHYMAPEISKGNYSKQIDIYACGVLLYEMLCGRVPFEGDTAGEILMKHLTDLPDLAGIPPALVPVLRRALAKEPSQRFASMTEFAQALEQANQASLAQPTAQPPSELPGSAPLPAAPLLPQAQPRANPPAGPAPTATRHWRHTLMHLGRSVALGGVLPLVTTAGLALLLRWDFSDLHDLGMIYFLTTAISWLVIVPTTLWQPLPTDSLGRRLLLMLGGLGVGLLTLWLDGWTSRSDADGLLVNSLLRSGQEGLLDGAGYLFYFGLAMGALRWWKMGEIDRPARFGFFPVLAASFWALLLLFVWPWPEPPLGAAALISASVVIQWACPWEPKPAVVPPPRRLRHRLH